MSGHGEGLTEQGALTLWRRQREGLVKTREETDREMHTHQLEMAEGGTGQDREENDRARHTHKLETEDGGTCQDTDKNRQTEAHSLPIGGRGRDLSGREKKPIDRGVLTNWRRQRRGLVRTWKETNQPRRTHFLETVEGLIRTRKKPDPSRHTHSLETEDEGTGQDTEKTRPTMAHSPTGNGRGTDLSGHGKKPTGRGTLTLPGDGRGTD